MNDHVLGRRGALKLLGAAALGAATVSQRPRRTFAARGWCQADPLFKIGDYLFDVTLSSDPAMLASATGPVKLTVSVPKEVSAQHVVSDLGFGHGYDVKVVKDRRLRAARTSIDVRVAVKAPAADSSLPVNVHLTSLSTEVVASLSTATGSANEEITWVGTIDTLSELDTLI
jgi:hypothetical protein